ncbi:GNAT family N-acetyltransferase [Pikeienuella piscinae]|uniref:GNAT family N-acetyltransferase n=1 Tax=Pikeienuella piscinae TaxID=2748098 RepID=A0A7L5BST2_9RHOB|nr:GNAT family N-acetyltransferase [Pikeienuella piscinae]QIE54730.1 GNAT family N-acetyltransferase [Pikeienuella piscinae]
MTPTLRRAGPEEDWTTIHRFVLKAFQHMDGRIDPPSSIHRWTPGLFAAEAGAGAAFLAFADGRLIGCLFARPERNALYLGKVAVAAEWRGHGLARALVGAAEAEARARGMNALVLQTRIELRETHAAFAALGFARIAMTRHPGFDRPTSIIMSKSLAGQGRRAV